MISFKANFPVSRELKGTGYLTRPDTRPIPVADGWAGAEMRVFTLFDGPTDGRTDGQRLL